MLTCSLLVAYRRARGRLYRIAFFVAFITPSALRCLQKLENKTLSEVVMCSGRGQTAAMNTLFEGVRPQYITDLPLYKEYTCVYTVALISVVEAFGCRGPCVSVLALTLCLTTKCGGVFCLFNYKGSRRQKRTCGSKHGAESFLSNDEVSSSQTNFHTELEQLFCYSPLADFTCIWNSSLKRICHVFQKHFYTRRATDPEKSLVRELDVGHLLLLD